MTNFREATNLLMDSSAAEFPRMETTDMRKPVASRLTLPVPVDKPPLRVLVADDHALNLNLVSRLLTKSGFLVVPVRDGKEALDALIASFRDDDGSAFQCAVLDMQMPVMTGVECARAFRAWESASGNAARWGKLPLVALTANVLEEHVTSCFDSGMARSLRDATQLMARDASLLSNLTSHAPIPPQNLFLSKPLRDEAINTLRSVATEHRMLVAVRTEEEAEAEADAMACAGGKEDKAARAMRGGDGE